MFFLDPNVPVLTTRGYIPASIIDSNTTLITRNGTLEKVIVSENVELLDKASRLSWYGSGESFYIHSNSVIFGRAGLLNFHQPDVFVAKDSLCSKFGFDSNIFSVSSFSGIEKAFFDLLKINTKRLRTLCKKRENITSQLNFLLYAAQTNRLADISKFLLGLHKLSDEAKIELIRKLETVVLRYENKSILYFPNIYDAYNFVEFLGRFGIRASIFKFRIGKFAVYFDASKQESPRPRRYFKQISSVLSEICTRPWVVISLKKKVPIIAAGVPLNCYFE